MEILLCNLLIIKSNRSNAIFAYLSLCRYFVQKRNYHVALHIFFSKTCWYNEWMNSVWPITQMNNIVLIVVEWRKKNVNNDHFILIWFGDSVFITIILHENNSSWSIYWYDGAMFFFAHVTLVAIHFFQRYNLILHIDLHVFYKIPVRYKEHTESAFLCANLAYFTLNFCNYEI